MKVLIQVFDPKTDTLKESKVLTARDFDTAMNDFITLKHYRRAAFTILDYNLYTENVLNYRYKLYRLDSVKYLEDKNVLDMKQLRDYLQYHDYTNIPYMEIYYCTHNYTQIFKLGEFYFTSNLSRGYKNISALKRLV